jgi:hypothetical protein
MQRHMRRVSLPQALAVVLTASPGYPNCRRTGLAALGAGLSGPPIFDRSLLMIS